MDQPDYIIVGAGSSGSVLAARLSEDPAVKVLVVEAGGSERKLILDMPVAWFRAMRMASVGWGYASEPEPFADGRRIPVPRGRVVGGCSTINGMMYSRGHPLDYDQWAQMGAKGWAFEDVLPYFRRSEANWRGESAYHGADGPLTVARHRTDTTIYPAIIKTAENLGYKHLGDFHGESTEGFSAPDFTVHRGRRASTAKRFLRPALTRGNLDLLDNALTTRVVIENGRAAGIEVERGGNGGQREVIRAKREVILSAGAINSPQILLLSGIGPAADLKAFGIEVVHDLKGVGRNLQDHAAVRPVFEASGPITFDHELRFDRMALSVARWWLAGTGPVAGLPVAAQGFIRTRDGLDRPDIQFLISPVAMDAGVWFPGLRARRGDYFSIACILLSPESRGAIMLRSPDPHDKAKIQFNLLSTEGDRTFFRRAVRFTRKFFSQAPASSLVKAETEPGDASQSDAEIDAYVRSVISTAMHPTSTCPMGAGPEAVLDEKLRVHGIGGLRVVDASVMPIIVGGNTNAPAIMIAEKAADLIRGAD